MLKPLALRAARLIEGGLERIGDRPDDQPVLDPYYGYATPDGVVLRGRVLTELRRAQPEETQHVWENLKQMVGLFVTDEVEGVHVRGGGAEAISDAEGYVRLTVPGDFSPGWTIVPVAIEGQEPVPFPALVPGPEATHMVISDIDDTVVETGAHSLARNLWTTFTGSALTRAAFGDAVHLLEAMSDEERNPVFYVSSSPWNMHHFLETLFSHLGIPRGPKFLRDLGITDEGFSEAHGLHKGHAIDVLMAANPRLPAFLMGDTGQHDAQVYREAVERHPGRVRGVALRESVPGASGDDADCIAAIEAAGVPCHHGPSFNGALKTWGLA
ncbi:phosphatase domain-containing protein [Jannaschia sp. W003]|uniref:phosphatase domain-containing protein n=1 Tax=Jannaschia sp. W003 TaxID=2867012 RepID=UPI0021A6BD75|nr:phosphatase domain-containing protein [Jannaschia sp. W003]UWQ22332.1 DUF2183 domain-containing protein [Jannaschia sp. W003]